MVWADSYDQRSRDSDAAVRRAVLSGLPDRERYRQARAVRGAELRRTGAGPCTRREAPASAVEDPLGSPRTAHRLQRQGVSAADHPEKDRRTRAVLRAVPAGAGP